MVCFFCESLCSAGNMATAEEHSSFLFNCRFLRAVPKMCIAKVCVGTVIHRWIIQLLSQFCCVMTVHKTSGVYNRHYGFMFLESAGIS